MDDIWVICIKYDYGVWDEAGYFLTEGDAELWIQTEHINEIDEHEALKKEYPDEWPGLGDVILTKFYPVRLTRAYQ